MSVICKKKVPKVYFTKCLASAVSGFTKVINGMKLVLLRTSHLMKHNGGYIQLRDFFKI